MAGEVTISRAYRYRLYPTASQADVLAQWCGAVRAVYNCAWEQRERHWTAFHRTHSKHISFASQAAEIKDLRAQFDWIAAPPADVLHYALRDLDRAYRAFFAGRAKYPTPRARGLHDSFRMKGTETRVLPLNAKWSAVRIQKLGDVKFLAHRAMRGDVRGVTISCRAGAWWVSFSNECEPSPAVRSDAVVGIDRGVVQTLTLSTGEVIQAPDCARLLNLRKRAQRVLARRKKGSGRYAKQRARVARLNARMAAQRVDWAHRVSADIARRFGMVAIEDLRIVNMTAAATGPGRAAKAGLNRSILEQSWGSFARFLDYKLNERGGRLIAVPPQYTSQTCSQCGVIDAESRKSQARFVCVSCGHAENADINAAKNIWLRSTELLDVEAGVVRPTKRQPQEHYHA